jgi:hypothetical protein
MAQTDAPPAETPQAPEAQPPQVEEAPASQRSTGGMRPQDARPGDTPLTRESAQDLMRQAYRRTRRLDGEAKAPAGTGERAGAQKAEPKAQVDKPGDGAVESAQTTAPKADAPADATARGRDPSTGRFQKAPAEARRPADEPPSSATPAEPEAAAPPAARAEEAPPAEDFKTERWQAAFADDPGLRRRVARISADPNLAPGRKAEMLAEKLTESLDGVRQERERDRQIDEFRRRDPTGYVRWQQQQEAQAEEQRQLELRITRMIADAYGVDATDPDFLDAGPQDGDDGAEAGLRRFVAFTSQKSPVLKQLVEEAVASGTRAVTERYEARIKALEERHKEALEVAVERARGQARSPYGAQRRAAPRSNGTGQRPVGEDEGLAVAQRAPDVATVRGLIGLGYQRRE